MAEYATQNYGLRLWKAEDKVEREGVNRNFEAVDEALASLTMVTGTYQGLGSAGNTAVTLGFRPKAVLVLPKNYSQASGAVGLSLDGANCGDIAINDTGFIVFSGLNREDTTQTAYYPLNPFRYLAWR